MFKEGVGELETDSAEAMLKQGQVRKNIRVLMPFVGSRPGGAQISAAILARYINEIPFNVTAVFPKGSRAGCIFQKRGVPVIWVPHPILDGPRKSLQSRISAFVLLFLIFIYALVFLALNAIAGKRFSIIHLNDDTALLAWGLAGRLTGSKVIWHVREGRKAPADWLRVAISDAQIFISDYARSRLLSSRRFRVIYNPVETTETLSASLHDHSNMGRIDAAGPIILTIGRDQIWKRPEWSAHALEAANQLDCDASLIFLGDYSTERQLELKSLVSPANREKIHFFGWVDNPMHFMKKATVLAHPAQNETFGRVFIEAFLAELPIVATRTGAAPEIIIDKGSGVLSPPDDLGAFCKNVVMLIKDEDLQVSLASEARRSVDRFDPVYHANKVAAFYNEILA